MIIHNTSRTNQFNLDIEDDECNYIWDLDHDWSKKYFRRNNIILYDIENVAVDEVGNHRKQYLCEGELLIVWTNGIRDWTPVSIAYETDPRVKKMISIYFMENSITKQVMEKCLIPATIDEIEKCKDSAKLTNYLDNNSKEKPTQDNDKNILGISEGQPNEAEKLDEGKLPNGPHTLPNCV